MRQLNSKMSFLPELEFIEAVEHSKNSGELANKRREKLDRDNIEAMLRGLAGRLPTYVKRNVDNAADVIHLDDYQSSRQKPGR